MPLYRRLDKCAWDNEDFVKAVKATGKNNWLLQVLWLRFVSHSPALSALEEGFEVFVVTDASGTFNAIARDSAWDRMSKAGQLINWFGLVVSYTVIGVKMLKD